MPSAAPDPKAGAPSGNSTAGTIPAAAVEDRSQYIRTMAKDMAAITGGGKAAAAPAQAVVPTKKEEMVGGVGLPVSEQPFFDRAQLKKEDRPQETIALPSVTEATEIVSQAAPVPAAQPVPQAQPSPTVADKDGERAAILERLRQKVESSAPPIQSSTAPVAPPVPVPPAPAPVSVPQQPIPTPPPAPISPPPVAPPVPAPPAPAPVRPPLPKNEWPDIPVPAPAFQPPLEETAPVPRMPQVTRTPVAPATPAPYAGLNTYAADFADRLDSRGATAFSVLAAEQDAKGATRPQALTQRKDRMRPVLIVGSGILLLVLAGGGIFATYQFVMNKDTAPVAPLSVPSIVFADEYKELEGSGTELMSALAAAAASTLVPGNVLVTYVTEPISDTKGITIQKPAAGGALIRALELPAPDILLRNIADESTVGIVRAGDETRPFLALRVDSYERTYAGMLTWEPLMERDLATLYPLYPARVVPVPVSAAISTTTATSTQAQPPEPIQAPALTRFADAIVSNHDVRVLRDSSGASLILYGYVDKQTLIIVRDEAAFDIILARLEQKK